MGSIQEIALELNVDEDMTENGSIPFSNLDRMQYIEDSQKYILDILNTCTVIPDHREGSVDFDNALPQSFEDFSEIFHDATSERSDSVI